MNYEYILEKTYRNTFSFQKVGNWKKLKILHISVEAEHKSGENLRYIIDPNLTDMNVIKTT